MDTYLRWLVWGEAKSAKSAVEAHDSYRDKDGKRNWAEWARKYPKANRLVTWAMTDADEWADAHPTDSKKPTVDDDEYSD